MVTRDELYRLVWSEPMTKIAGQFEVSGSYLARVCTLLNVPRPERGYWAKLAVGKAARQTPLPAPQPGDPLHWSREGQRIAAPKPKAPPRRKPEKKVRIAHYQFMGSFAAQGYILKAAGRSTRARISSPTRSYWWT